MRFLILLCLFISPAVSGQEILDNYVVMRAEYEFCYKQDSTMKGYYSDIFYLDVCKSGQSFFYSRATQYRDSVMQALLRDGLGTYEVMDKVRNIPRGLAWHIKKVFKTNRYVYCNKFITRVFSAEAVLEIPKWELQEDTLTINGQVCKKATGYVAGRYWQVWYAPDILVNDGPWLLWGLPGLVLRAEDSNHYFKFVCVDFGLLAQAYPVFLSSDHVVTTTMSLPQLLKAEIMFEESPDDFMEAYLGARRVGEERIRRKYIPLISPVRLKNK